MKPLDIIEKIKQSGLCGRGGAGYPTGVKWEEMYKKNYPSIYICVNGSEGEPGTKKDGYILENYLKELIEGIKIAYFLFPQTKKIYLYLRKDYYEEYKKPIEDLKENLPIIVFKEPGGYLCGENTVLVNSIEGKRWEPRRKPPYLSEKGLWGSPTIVNNIETFYRIYEIINNKYQNKRFYTIAGDAKNPGVYDLPVNITIAEVLKLTDNKITNDYFVQVGGGASGIFYTYDETDSQSANYGTGVILVYNKNKTNMTKIFQEKLAFLIKENCGKCTPCREGLYQLYQLAKNNSLENKKNFRFIEDLLENLKTASFCGLGTGAGEAFNSLWQKRGKIWQ
ncbi:MAG: NADH-ubiquinone oxidoreductase-F iron-sulfur binding region domain-containing protein [Microgenomates group bacterium]